MPAKKRAELVRAFQAGALDVLIGSQAMHAGVTLTRASNMLFVERWWVPSREEQAEDRIYRIGQKNAVNIRYLMAKNTVDNHIAELVDKKRAVIERVMGGEKVNAPPVQIKDAATQGSGANAVDVDRGLAMAIAARVAAQLQAAGECAITVADLR